MRRRCATTFLIASALASVAPGGHLLGQPTQPGDGDAGLSSARDEARNLAEQGVADLDHGKVAEGVGLLEQAEHRFHAPTHLLYLARGYQKLGKLGQAAESYERLISEVLPNYAPDAFRDAQRLGRDELATLSAQMGKLHVALIGAKRDGATVAVDGHPPMPLIDPLIVEAGAHSVVVVVGADSRSGEATLGEHDEQTVNVTFPETTANGELNHAPAVPPPASSSPPYVAVAVIAFSIGAGGIAAGAATGVASLNKVSTLKARCPTQKNCSASDQPLADDARTLGNASTATFVIGGAAIVTGVIFTVLAASGSRSNTPPHATITPFVGWGVAGLRGRF